MPTQEQKTTNPVEMFEATFDRGAQFSPDFDDAAVSLATSEVMRLFLRRRRVLLGLSSLTTTSAR
jgi:hypothetical protein